MRIGSLHFWWCTLLWLGTSCSDDWGMGPTVSLHPVSAASSPGASFLRSTADKPRWRRCAWLQDFLIGKYVRVPWKCSKELGLRSYMPSALESVSLVILSVLLAIVLFPSSYSTDSLTLCSSTKTPAVPLGLYFTSSEYINK